MRQSLKDKLKGCLEIEAVIDIFKKEDSAYFIPKGTKGYIFADFGHAVYVQFVDVPKHNCPHTPKGLCDATVLKEHTKLTGMHFER